MLTQASRDHENRANYDQLERLASRVIQPLLGSKGLYEPPRPEAKSTSNDHSKSKMDKLTPVSSIGSGGSTPDMEGKIAQQVVLFSLFILFTKKRLPGSRKKYMNRKVVFLSCVFQKSAG